mgnify:CR=1 FL=1
MISLYVQVLCEINRDSTATIEELAVRIDKTSTTVRRVIEELKAARLIECQKIGKSNNFLINRDKSITTRGWVFPVALILESGRAI